MGTSYNPPIVKNGLVLNVDPANKKSYVGSGNTIYDLSKNKYTGTLTNGPVYSSSNAGKLTFDGTDDFINVGALSGSFSSFTVFVWFRPTSVSNYKNVIDCNFSYNGTTGNIGPRLEMTSTGYLGWIYSNVTNNNDLYYSHGVRSSGLPANSWHCAAITYNGTSNTSVTYYNGLNTGIARTGGTGGSATGFIGVMNNVIIGKGFHLAAATQRSLVGDCSVVQIYNRDLTASEILQNYIATKGRFGL